VIVNTGYEDEQLSGFAGVNSHSAVPFKAGGLAAGLDPADTSVTVTVK
jgi:hypothetical protein